MQKPKDDEDFRLLSRAEAAEFLGTKESTLAHWTCTGRQNLPIVKIGRLVKYRISDLKNFIRLRTKS